MNFSPPADGRRRCKWCLSDPLYIDYHDHEWGVPITDSKQLFQLLCLEGAQAGLSWLTILKRRDNYRRTFVDFDPDVLVTFSKNQRDWLLQDEGIIRNRLKIQSVFQNAECYKAITKTGSSFSDFIWSFAPINTATVAERQAAAQHLSESLKRLGFTFVGPIIVLSFMQSAGLVNDHETDCFRFTQLQDLSPDVATDVLKQKITP